MGKKLFILTISSIILTVSITSQAKEINIKGSTMGTTYSIKAYTSFFTDVLSIKKKIKSTLDKVNNSMNIFNKNSEISRFNSLSKGKMEISEEFYNVLLKSEKVYIESDGAFDITVSPLIELWGFGRNKTKKIPSKKEIKKTVAITGFKNIVLEKRKISKKIPGISMNLGAIAKGYGVDMVAKTLRNNNIKNFFVEIGGEVYASGKKPDGRKWVIGIANPTKNTSIKSYIERIELENRAVATSGNYRNYFDKNGKSYTHIIDPKTGYPVSNKIVSVSVIHRNCTIADSLATAVMVEGVKKGMDLLKKFRAEGMIVVHDDGFIIYKTKGFIFLQ